MPRPADPAPDQLSLRDAARLVGQPRDYLRELAAAGRLGVRLHGDPGDPKWRVTRAGLIEAGLLAEAPTAPPADPVVRDLIALVREQSARLATLEEQRFQLGAQLGAALERIAALEERAPAEAALPIPAFARSAALPPRRPSVRQAMGSLGALGAAGARRGGELSARLLAGRLRLPALRADEPA